MAPEDGWLLSLTSKRTFLPWNPPINEIPPFMKSFYQWEPPSLCKTHVSASHNRRQECPPPISESLPQSKTGLQECPPSISESLQQSKTKWPSSHKWNLPTINDKSALLPSVSASNNMIDKSAFLPPMKSSHKYRQACKSRVPASHQWKPRSINGGSVAYCLKLRFLSWKVYKL